MEDRADKSRAILVTRPGMIGQQLADIFTKNGWLSFYLPTLEISALPMELCIEDYEIAIFISVNAVNYGLINKSLYSVLPNECIAVGSGTKRALQEHGIDNVIIPNSFNSEGLLELKQLESVKNKQILIVKGFGGRTKLIDELLKRGANCFALDVYKRVSVEVDIKQLKDFLDIKTKLVTIASIETLDSLTSNLNRINSNPRLREKLHLVVASQRIEQHAINQGYQSITIAETASNEAMEKAVSKIFADENC